MIESVRIRRRRLIALLTVLVAAAAPPQLLGHRGAHIARNLLLPGAGVVEQHRILGLAFAVATIVATVSWVRWGMDWTVGFVILSSMVVSAALATSPVATSGVAPVARAAQVLRAPIAVRSAHEFPLVVLVISAFAWVRAATLRIPVLRRLAVRRARTRAGLSDLGRLGEVDRCRAAALVALALRSDDPRRIAAAEAIAAPDVAARARRIGLAARARIGGDPFRRDHASARAAMMLCASSGAPSGTSLLHTSLLHTSMLHTSLMRTSLLEDANRGALGVPCSEPGWVRPLDATLAAIAIGSATWPVTFGEAFPLRRGHRHASWWTPLGLGAGSMPPWEHAACTGLARGLGWIGDDDWPALRRSALGAAARGSGHPHDERLIAAARVWLTFVDDAAASRIIARPTVRHDPLAVALDLLATRLAADPYALRCAGQGAGQGAGGPPGTGTVSTVPVARSTPPGGILPP